MNTDRHMSARPAAPVAPIPRYQIFFLLFGGPLAWFLQLNAGFALATQPCFLDNQRFPAPRLSLVWSWPAMIWLLIAALAIALLSVLTAWRAYQRTKTESSGDHLHLMEIGSGRNRFIALWGICFGAGSAVVILMTLVAFFVLPRCAG
ncbi:MAG TPA: hypothetical protein VHW95_10120 [Steroidobacteraceae bacterium]|nr:hypothetical protein [Steroidobacteraceae bacterium]